MSRDPSMPGAKSCLAGSLSLWLLVAGCATPSAPTPAPREIGLTAFSRPSGEAESSSDEGDELRSASDAVPVPAEAEPPWPRRLGAGDLDPEQVEPWLDAVPAGRTLPPGARIVVDAMIGQVNGRPIFADKFFETIEDRLRAEGRGLSPQEFERFAHEIVFLQLREQVFSKLFIAEAESQLTQEQRRGILAWLTLESERVLAQRGGVEQEVRRELQDEEQQSLEEFLEDRKNQALIRKLIRDRIQPRVIVSWRDVEQEYRKERWQAKFNPPAEITLARICLAVEEEAVLIEQVTERLEAGEDFMAVAESLNQSDCGIWMTFVASVEEQFREGAVRDHVVRLKAAGDSTSSFVIGNRTWWVHLAAFDQPPQRGLYDPFVQRTVYGALQRARWAEEEKRYRDSLLEEGIYDEVELMVDRLLRIAILRYGP